MAGRCLSPDEHALWSRVTDSVVPLAGRVGRSVPPVGGRREPVVPVVPPVPAGPARTLRYPAPIGEATLDGGWDRRLRRGAVSPDRTIDLHGHTLASAHAALDHALERAVADDLRVLLVVTGRPPRRDAAGEVRRGLIRGSIHDWLSGSRHVARIAAVRNAHPRHGGAGALYLIMRRQRGA